MKNINIIYFMLFALLFPTETFAQQPWKRFFHSSNYGSFSYSVVECYDRGFVTGGVLKRQDGVWPGWLVKTDVNGLKLWEKIIDGEHESPLMAPNKTTDGGFILGGHYVNDEGQMDAYVMKLNACAEPAWCKFFPEADGAPSQIFNGTFELPDGSYICERYKPVWEQYHRWSLIKLDHDGNIQWINYFDLNTSWVAQLDFELDLTSDTCFLITSSVIDTIRPDGAGGELPLWSKVDADGNLLWDTEWELPEQQSPATGRSTIEDNRGQYYSGGYRCPWIMSYIYKLNNYGDTLCNFRFYDTIPFPIGSQINTMSYYDSNTFIIGSQFSVNNDDTWWAYSITDTTGKISKRTYEQERIVFIKSIITSDDKIVCVGITGSDYPQHPSAMGLYKFNMNLEYDSIYTVPRTYDSLCPYPILSDTIPMPGICQYVDIPDPVPSGDLLKLNIYPNPASQYVTIEIPEYSANTTKGHGITQQQFRPLSGEVQLSLMNLSSQIIKTEIFDASERNQVVNVSKLPSGMYVLHLTQKGKFVAQGKVMVVR